MQFCPLCASHKSREFFTDEKRIYLQCTVCSLVYVPAVFHLTVEQERAEYDLHQNSLEDVGYRRFLNRLFDPLSTRLEKNLQGLDFGCGPGPLLAEMFRQEGHTMALFDSYYANHPEVLQDDFDFITCSEVIEHLKQPALVLDQLWCSLRTDGWLGIMTKLVKDRKAFADWHYKNDPTHICFYSRETFRWIQKAFCCELEFVGADVIILHKSPHTRTSYNSIKPYTSTPSRNIQLDMNS